MREKFINDLLDNIALEIDTVDTLLTLVERGKLVDEKDEIVLLDKEAKIHLNAKIDAYNDVLVIIHELREKYKEVM